MVFLSGSTPSISDGITTLIDAASSILTMITGNPILLLLSIAAPVVGIGIGIFKKVKG